MYTSAGLDVQVRIRGMLKNLKSSQAARNKRILEDVKGRYTELVKAKKISKSLNSTLGHLRELLEGAEALYAKILVADTVETGGVDSTDKQDVSGDADEGKDVSMSEVKEDDDEDSD